MSFFKKYMGRITYPRFFLGVGFLAGVLFIIVTPPFQSPDEINHYFRVSYIVQGHLGSEQEGEQIGGLLPERLAIMNYNLTVNDEGTVPGHADRKVSLDTLTREFNISKYTKESTRIFIHFPNTVLNSFFTYIPHVVGVLVGKVFLSSELGVYYSARFAGLLFYILGGYIILQNVSKRYTDLFFVSLMLPMSLYLGSMVTADTASIIVVFGATAFFVTQRAGQKEITRQNIWKYILLAVAIGFVKPVYVYIAGLIFIVPFSKTLSWLQNVGVRIAIMSVTALEVLFWLIVNNGTAPYRSDIVIDQGVQITAIIDQPLRFAGLIVHFLYDNFTRIIMEIIGVFGWLDTVMPKEGYILGGVLLLLLIVKGKRDSFSWKEKSWVLFIIGCVISTVILFLFLTWSPAGQWTLQGFQGRYMLPILPLILIFFSALSPLEIKRVPRIVVFLVVAVLFVVALTTIAHRFFI